jgi:peptidase E
LENLRKPIELSKVLFFPNEKATQETINSNKYYDWMINRGFEKKNINIFDYYHPNEFTGLNIDCIHISGGNTFQMLDRLRKCNADKLITDYIKSGVIYIGGSAGAHIVSKSIKHLIGIDDNPTGISDYNALGFFNGILFCHYTEERKKYYDRAVINSEIQMYKLTDDDSIILDE